MIRNNQKLNTKIVASAEGGENTLVLEPQIRKMPDNSLFISWTGGGSFEPCQKNKTFFSKSYDSGMTWEKPKVLFQHSKKGVFTPCIFFDGKRLFAYPGSYYDDTNFAQDMQSYWSVSEDFGKTFSSPKSFPGCINNIHIKHAQRIGKRWIFACSWIELDGNIWAPPGGYKPCIVSGNEIPSQGDVFEWNGNNHTEYCGVLISDDNGVSYRINGRIGNKNLRTVEPTFTQISDGTLVMFLRTNKPWIYESRSTDMGETWSQPTKTDIPSAISKAQLIKDSKGNIYLLHNPNPEGRNPLELWISHDDMKSWDEKIVLLSSENPNEWICYPDGYIDEENSKLCFAWDNRKEIYYSEFDLS